jgi:hypothetical protein
MEEIVCEAYDRDPTIERHAISALEKIGGYSSIKALADLLLNDPPIKRRSGDQITRSVRYYAAESLSRLVPEAHIPTGLQLIAYPPTETKAREWYNWVLGHREQLGRLEPNETVELDATTCAQRRVQKLSKSAVVSPR